MIDPKRDETAVVTGAAGVLGQAVARALIESGHRVGLLHHQRDDEVRRLVELVGDDRAVAVRADLTSLPEVRDAVSTIGDALGPPLISVNCGGVRIDGLMAMQRPEEWHHVVSVNLFGTYHLARTVLPGMVKARFGRIINVVSGAGLVGSPGQTAYSASKAGVIGLTRSLAREYGRRGITVNALSPGFMESAMTEGISARARAALSDRMAVDRPTRPEEVAAAVPFLIEAGHLTGQILSIDGGMTV